MSCTALITSIENANWPIKFQVLAQFGRGITDMMSLVYMQRANQQESNL